MAEPAFRVPSSRLDRRFAPLLARCEVSDFEQSTDTIIGIWPDGRIGYINPAYLRFAEVNGGGADFEQRWGLGAQLFEALPRPVAAFYRAAIDGVGERAEAWSHDYLCSSPSEERAFRLLARPLLDGAVLLVHQLVAAQPHPEAVAADDLSAYVQDNGFIAQCSHCRSLRRRDDPQRWELVCAAIASPPPKVTHGLCASCMGYYYGGAGKAS